MKAIRLLPGQQVLDIDGIPYTVEDYNFCVSVFDASKEEAFGKLIDLYGEETMTEQILNGMEVEQEHSDIKEIQYSIALDHILEFADYYVALEQMEESLRNS